MNLAKYWRYSTTSMDIYASVECASIRVCVTLRMNMVHVYIEAGSDPCFKMMIVIVYNYNSNIMIILVALINYC